MDKLKQIFNNSFHLNNFSVLFITLGQTTFNGTHQLTSELRRRGMLRNQFLGVFQLCSSNKLSSQRIVEECAKHFQSV